jgi:hypothetical protein
MLDVTSFLIGAPLHHVCHQFYRQRFIGHIFGCLSCRQIFALYRQSRYFAILYYAYDLYIRLD